MEDWVSLSSFGLFGPQVPGLGLSLPFRFSISFSYPFGSALSQGVAAGGVGERVVLELIRQSFSTVMVICSSVSSPLLTHFSEDVLPPFLHRESQGDTMCAMLRCLFGHLSLRIRSFVRSFV